MILSPGHGVYVVFHVWGRGGGGLGNRLKGHCMCHHCTVCHNSTACVARLHSSMCPDFSTCCLCLRLYRNGQLLMRVP